jgi:hypothetical protein
MPKKTSDDEVSEESEMQKRFETLEADTKFNRTALERVVKHLFPDEKPPENKDVKTTPPAVSPAKKFFQDMGILAKD